MENKLATYTEIGKKKVSLVLGEMSSSTEYKVDKSGIAQEYLLAGEEEESLREFCKNMNVSADEVAAALLREANRFYAVASKDFCFKPNKMSNKDFKSAVKELNERIEVARGIREDFLQSRDRG